MSTAHDQGERTRAAILSAMLRYEAGHGVPATIRQIAASVRPDKPLSSGLVCHHLRLLVQEGAVCHTPHQARTYRLTKKGHAHDRP